MRESNSFRTRARRILAWAGLISFAAGLLLLPAAAHSAAAVSSTAASALSGGATSPVSHDSSVTVTGPKMYDPTTGKSFPQPGKVTVSQTSELTDQLIQLSWSNFTPTQNGGQEYYQQTNYYGVMAVECRGADPTAWSDCYEDDTHGLAEISGPAGPPNASYAITTAGGTGQANILIETMLENSQLGCSDQQACSLVIVPGQGGLPPLNGQPADCPDHSADVGFAGTGWALASNTFFDTTGGCSWNDRIIVPLHFAPLPTGCPQRNAAFNVTGSPMMAVAMQHWLPSLCAGGNGMTINYDSTLGEPTAVQDAVSATTDENGPGATNVALTTQPASADGVSTENRSFVYAPIAVSAASVAYWIDNNQTGQPMSGLRLDPRLLAKLLTTSYDPDIACTTQGQTNCDAGVDKNPFSILKDKEFKSLNPSFVKDITFTTAQTRLAPTVPFGSSDITWTVTRWIAANSDATSFLKGTFDPWGMHVNSYYINTQYPANQFLTHDPNFPWQEEYSPVFPLAQAVTYQALNEDSGGIIPVPPPTGGFSKDPPEPVGNRMLTAILDQGDAALNAFPTAAIENAAGKYVAPTNASMAAALSHMVSNGNGTLAMNLTNTDPDVYPLTMVIYAMVPTSGLPHAKAAAIARFLDFAAGAGQSPGELPGNLPNGYLPLPASMRAQTRKLAVEVADQHGNSPSGGSHGGGSTPGGSNSSSPSPSSSSAPSSPAKSPTSGPAGTHPITLVSAHTGPLPITRFILPALLILGALAALGGSSALAEAAEGGMIGLLRRARRAASTRSRAVLARSRSRPRQLLRRRKP